MSPPRLKYPGGNRRRRITPSHRAHAVRVATAATGLVALVSVALGAALDLLVSHRLTTQVSQQVATRLGEARADLARPSTARLASAFASGDEGGRFGLGIYGAPVFVWEVAPDGHVMRSTPGAPRLPARPWGSRDTAGSLTIGTTTFRIASLPRRSGWLVTGESLAELSHVR